MIGYEIIAEDGHYNVYCNGKFLCSADSHSEAEEEISKEPMRAYLRTLRQGGSFDYICNHGHEFTKYELITIIKEFDYVMGEVSEYNEGSREYLGRVADSIEEWNEY